MTIELMMLLICIAGSTFASGSETALVSASRTRLQQLAKNGKRGARRAMGLLDDRERVLVVTLITTNVFNISAGAISTLALRQWIGPFGPIVAIALMASILLVLSEIVPKAFFRHHAEHALIRAALIWQILTWALFPITFPIHLFTRLLFRVFRCEAKNVYRTRDEIKLMIEESVESGGLQESQHDMLQSTLDYSSTIVREVMVPISEVALLPETARTEDFLDLVRDKGYTRIPIYRERVDQIVGLANIFDVLYDNQRKTFIRPYMRPIRIVPETKAIDKLFVEMQGEREQLAVVVNEFGACFGIVTLEDIMEEIFGELADEHEDATLTIQEKEPNCFLVNGMTDIDDLKDETAIDITKEGFETVGGYVLHRMGRVPQKGESFRDGEFTVRIVKADRYTVKTVEMVRGNPFDTNDKRVP
jgi:CBS domain containing-hemolysin-like protein